MVCVTFAAEGYCTLSVGSYGRSKVLDNNRTSLKALPTSSTTHRGGLNGNGSLQEEGEDIMDMDRIDADYVAIPELDTYDDADLDRREYGNMDYSERRAAERELAER